MLADVFEENDVLLSVRSEQESMSDISRRVERATATMVFQSLALSGIATV